MTPEKPEGIVPGGLSDLSAASASWVERGQPQPLARWLGRELDPDGIPHRLAVADWLQGLRMLAGAVAARPDGWPEGFDERAEGWFRGALRFSRPDGSPVFGPRQPADDIRPLLRTWAERLSDPGFSTVLDWWFPGPSAGRHAPPPLPADARPDRPLASLRDNWLREGDILAVDHRSAGTSTRFELTGLGRVWLGPSWSPAGGQSADASKARPTLWVSQSSADVLEWRYRVGPARVTRTAVLLRGRQLALIGEQWDGPGDPGGFRLELGPGLEARPIPDSRGLSLAAVAGRAGSARALPIGLPRPDYPTPLGQFGVDAGRLTLMQSATAGARRVWRPLLVSWGPKRNRQPVHWRALTVSEGSRVCPPDVAFAARVTWGRDETLVIYRSLAPPGLRAFLGHQTTARFLIGLFGPEGEIQPLVKVDE